MTSPRRLGTRGAGPAWMRAAGYVAAALIGLLLLVAGVAKAIETDAFAASIEALQVGSSFHPVPAGWGWPLAVAAIVVEVALGAALLLGWRTLRVLLATAGLLVFFLVVTALQWAAGETASCGCFGSLVERTPRQEFVWLLVYLAVLAPAFLAPPRRERVPVWRAALVSGATGFGLMLALAGPWLPSHAIARSLGRVTPWSSVGEQDPRAGLRTILPELWEDPGSHLVVMTSFAEGPALEEDVVLALNDLSAGLDVPVSVWFLVAARSAEPDPDRYYELQWEVALALSGYRLADEAILQYYDVQWSLRQELDPADPVPVRMVRDPSRFLPRTYWIEAGRVTRIWSGVPSRAEADAAAVSGGTLP